MCFLSGNPASDCLMLDDKSFRGKAGHQLQFLDFQRFLQRLGWPTEPIQRSWVFRDGDLCQFNRHGAPWGHASRGVGRASDSCVNPRTTAARSRSDPQWAPKSTSGWVLVGGWGVEIVRIIKFDTPGLCQKMVCRKVCFP